MRLRMRRSVAGDHRGSTVMEAQRSDQRVGEAARLVGDDAPGVATLLERLEHRQHRREDPGFARHALFVAAQEVVAQRDETLVVGSELESHADHAARARADHRPKALERQCRQAVRDAQVVGRTGQVGRAVDQRAVQVEQHRHLEARVHCGLRQANR